MRDLYARLVLRLIRPALDQKWYVRVTSGNKRFAAGLDLSTPKPPMASRYPDSR